MVSSATNKQKGSSKSSGMVRRVSSSSSIMVDADGGMSAADKKRNKLGYHRTAVACGHCRRRKIRCIPSPEMNTTRCQNCIRLKKECQFFPVDQMTLPDSKRNRSTTKIDTHVPDSETSVSSSPGVKLGAATEQFDPYRSQMSPSIPSGPSAFSVLSGSSELLRNAGQQYEYQQHFESHSWEHTTPIEQVPQYSGDRPFDPSPRSYWQSHDSNQHATFPHSSYSNPSTSIGTSAGSHDQTFAFANPVAGSTAYHYQPQSARITDISITDSAMHPFGMYRSQTLPNLDRSTAGVGMPTLSTNIRSQTMTNPHYTHEPHSSSYSQPSGMASGWTETSHMNSDYVHAGRNQTWYNNTASLDKFRGEQQNATQMLPAQTNDTIHFRRKPG